MDFPALPSEIVAVVAHHLHESHAGTATYQHAWRTVRRLTGVSRTWRAGAEQHLVEHVAFNRAVALLKLDEPLRIPRDVNSVQFCIATAHELLDVSPWEWTAALLLRYVASHPEAAALRERVAVELKN